MQTDNNLGMKSVIRFAVGNCFLVASGNGFSGVASRNRLIDKHHLSLMTNDRKIQGLAARHQQNQTASEVNMLLHERLYQPPNIEELYGTTKTSEREKAFGSRRKDKDPTACNCRAFEDS